eukprot:7087210-Ditylum_brightwellii.AAC.1
MSHDDSKDIEKRSTEREKKARYRARLKNGLGGDDSQKAEKRSKERERKRTDTEQGKRMIQMMMTVKRQRKNQRKGTDKKNAEQG